MKKLLIFFSILAVLIVIVISLFQWYSTKYNQMVALNEGTVVAWSQVENVYQRRLDLIPNLVNTVQGSANFERDTLTDVIEARAKATAVNIDPSNLSAEQISLFEQAQGGLTSALSRLLVTVERYPTLLSTQAFRDLQVQLEGTENRITVERQRFNEIVQSYNTYIRSIPNNFIAGFSGFEVKGYFQAQAGADVVPTVDFSNP